MRHARHEMRIRLVGRSSLRTVLGFTQLALRVQRRGDAESKKGGALQPGSLPVLRRVLLLHLPLCRRRGEER